MQGDGLWRNNKHEKYVGSWKNNKAHGYGIYATEKSHYQGTGYFIQASLPISSSMVMASKTLSMEMYTKDTISTASPMERDNIFGLQEPLIRGNSLTEFEKEKEYGSVKMATSTTVTLVMIEKMDPESTSGRMVIVTKEILVKI